MNRSEPRALADLVGVLAVGLRELDQRVIFFAQAADHRELVDALLDERGLVVPAFRGEIAERLF